MSHAKEASGVAASHSSHAGSIGKGFTITEGESDICTVQGVDSETPPNTIDIDKVATITVTSSDPDRLQVYTPVGMSFKLFAPKPLPVKEDTGDEPDPASPVVTEEATGEEHKHASHGHAKKKKKAAAKGDVTVTVEATWKDGTIGPITHTFPVKIRSLDVVDLTVTPKTLTAS